MRGNHLVAFVVCGLSLTASGEAGSIHHWDQASSVTGGAIALVALGVPLIKSDEAGLAQAGLSIAAGTGSAFALKALVHERRPDGSDRHSFPSGHASFSFAAAASLENRYGWEIGLPGFALASFVGVARVEAKRHHWYDVVAGAAIGSTSGFLLTSRPHDAVRVAAWGDGRGGGLSLRATFR